jgi:hypothetical protein
MTFIVHGARGEEVTTVVRLRADTAFAKARDLEVAGWRVIVECANCIESSSFDLDNPLSDSRDESAQALRQIEIDHSVAG